MKIKYKEVDSVDSVSTSFFILFNVIDSDSQVAIISDILVSCPIKGKSFNVRKREKRIAITECNRRTIKTSELVHTSAPYN